MSTERTWDEATRNKLCEELRSTVRGEVRLMQHHHEDILELCRYLIEDECPTDEFEGFMQFAAGELALAAERLADEKSGWPDETDCDRLDRAEAALRDRGIVFWQVSPCCDTCTLSELSERIDRIDARYRGFRSRLRGYAFFIDQGMADMLADSPLVRVGLAYGWCSPDGSNLAPELYKPKALAIAGEVCECLHEHGFEPDWDGDLGRKIVITLRWQRRMLLE